MKLFKKKPKFGRDYQFADNQWNSEFDCFEILTGKYKGVIFNFGKVTLAEIDGRLVIKFDYRILYSIVNPITLNYDNKDFVHCLGAILHDIIENGIEKEPNVTAHRTDNSIEPDIE